MSASSLPPTAVPPNRRRRFWFALAVLALPFLAVFAVSLHYERSGGGACASCHEIWQPYSDWHNSSHRNVNCGECHGDVFTLDAGFHLNNMGRVFTHISGKVPESPRLRTADVLKMIGRCEKCHRAETTSWQSSAHSA